jgi:hypothetical protein
MRSEDDQHALVSYLTLRRAVGALGVLLPVVLVVGNRLFGGIGLEHSISDYYGTPMRDVFVGVLFALGWFLFSYRGYEPADDIAGDLAWFFAMGVALFPTTSQDPTVRLFHFVCAGLLFGVLAYFALFLFTKSSPDVQPTKAKCIRNRIYRICGVTMLLCIAGIAVFQWWFADSAIASRHPVFWLESLALWAFGWSWFVKGETLVKDRSVPWQSL